MKKVFQMLLAIFTLVSMVSHKVMSVYDCYELIGNLISTNTPTFVDEKQSSKLKRCVMGNLTKYIPVDFHCPQYK